MAGDEYLRRILAREAVDTGPYSPIRGVQSIIYPSILAWAGNRLVNVSPSGSFAKGTANLSGTDIDLFISLSYQTTESLRDIHNKLFDRMQGLGHAPKRQNVSINVNLGGYSVDLVPARRQDAWSNDHSLYRRKADTWTKTNVSTHIAQVSTSGRLEEIRVIKLWRNQKGFEFESFYLELTVIEALKWAPYGALDANVQKVFEYLAGSQFLNARVVDPANTNNVISDDLTVSEKLLVQAWAGLAAQATQWTAVVV